MTGFLACHSVVCSYAYAVDSSRSSSNAPAISCSPIGSPQSSYPQGRDSPQMPARFSESVKMSARYMLSGSAARSPMGNAVVGLVGQAITSTSCSAASKSALISVRTCCALR